MRSYGVARTLFTLMSLVGWAGILLGIVGAFGGSSIGGELHSHQPLAPLFKLLYALPGVAFSIAGLVVLALSQIGRAGVDAAEYSQQMLQLSRDSLAVSRQSLRQAEQVRTSFEALKFAWPTAPAASYPTSGTTPSEPSASAPEAPTPKVGYGSVAGEAALSRGPVTPTLSAPTPDFAPAPSIASFDPVKSS